MIRLGYLKEKNGYDIDDQLLKSLTHLNISFAKVVNTDGVVELNLVDEDKFRKFRAQNPNIVMSLAIGGWGAGNFSEAASTLQTRETFTLSAIEILMKYNLDGIDIDWEYPGSSEAGISSSPEDTKNFTLLLKKLRTELDILGSREKRHYILTVAAGASARWIDNVEIDKLYQLTDFINLMTYDMGGSFRVAGHHASLYESRLCDKKGGAYFVELYEKAGYGRDKIVFGAAFYGRGGTGTDGINCKYTGEEGLYFEYHDILTLIDDSNFDYVYDEDAKAAYLYDGNTFITFETSDSIRAKIDYVIENKLAGIMFWEYATDNTGTLLDVVVNYRENE